MKYTYTVQVKDIESKTVIRVVEVNVEKRLYQSHEDIAREIAKAMGETFKTITEIGGHKNDKLGVIFKLGGQPMLRFVASRVAVSEREAIEREIVGAIVEDALAAGCELSVCDLDGECIDLHRSRNKGEVMAALFALDGAHLVLRHLEKKLGGYNKGSVTFVYGNDGDDVIHDSSSNVEAIVERGTTLAQNYYNKRIA